MVDGVIEGAGFGVEILYLDRSEGDAVTPHQLCPHNPSGATIRLFYRPGHYDLLYPAEQNVNMEPIVNYQYAMTSDYSNWNEGPLGFDVDSSLMAIPNLMADPSFPMGTPMSPMCHQSHQLQPVHSECPPNKKCTSRPCRLMRQSRLSLSLRLRHQYRPLLLRRPQ